MQLIWANTLQAGHTSRISCFCSFWDLDVYTDGQADQRTTHNS